MATIEENLILLKNTKSSIRQSIINKGVEVSDSDSFASYSSKIDEIETTIDVFDNKIRFAYSRFKAIPNNFVGFEKITDGGDMFSSCTSLRNFDKSMPQLTNGYNMFRYCGELISVNSQFTQLTTGNHMFEQNYHLSSFNIPLNNLLNGDAMFFNCTGLITIITDLSSLTSAINMFNGCTALENITLTGTLNCALSLSDSTLLTVDSLMNIINSLTDLTGQSSKTLTLGTDNLNKLTDEQKAVATNKNWVLQ